MINIVINKKVGVTLKVEVYIDLIFGVNTLMDFLLLSIMQKIIKKPSKRVKRILAAMLGGVGACLSIAIPVLRYGIALFFFGIILAACMLKIVFTYESIAALVKDVVIYYSMTFLIGGILNYLYYYTSAGYYITSLMRRLPSSSIKFLVVLFFFGIATCFIRLSHYVWGQIHGNRDLFYTVELVLYDKKLILKGFLDTGNHLREPVTMRPVIIANYSAIESILPEELQEYTKNFMSDIKHRNIDRYAVRIKWIPFHAVGTEDGILPGIVFDEVNIIREDGVTIHNEKITVAVYHGKLTVNDNYHIILQEELL